MVNGPNGARQLGQLNTFPTMKACSANPGAPWPDFDANGARHLDDVGTWQAVEPAIDFTSTAAWPTRSPSADTTAVAPSPPPIHLIGAKKR